MNDETRIQYWVGDGTYGPACFPGNLLIYLIDIDHNTAVFGGSIPGLAVASENPEEHLKNLWRKTVAYEYIKPYYEKLILGILDLIAEYASSLEPNNEDGNYTILDAKMEDYLPTKE